MGFYREREEKRRKMRKVKAILFSIFAVLLAFFVAFSLHYPPNTWKYYLRQPSVSERKSGELRIHFLSVGQGDCTIVEFPDGKSMIIDGGDGNEETAETILRYANALKIKKFDYLVATHSDSDHVGSLDVVLSVKGAKTAYCPKIDDYTINGEYAEFCSALDKSGATKVYTEMGVFHRSEGEYPYRFAFLSPHKIDNPQCEYNKVNDGDHGDDAINDTSAVLLVEYAGRRALFTGDASESVEASLIRSDKAEVWRVGELSDLYLKADILKVSHHGSNDATGTEFLNYLQAKTAIISCGADNAYGHPHEETLARLAENGVDARRTDVSGNIMITVSASGEYTIKS